MDVQKLGARLATSPFGEQVTNADEAAMILNGSSSDVVMEVGGVLVLDSELVVRSNVTLLGGAIDGSLAATASLARSNDPIADDGDALDDRRLAAPV